MATLDNCEGLSAGSVSPQGPGSFGVHPRGVFSNRPSRGSLVLIKVQGWSEADEDGLDSVQVRLEVCDGDTLSDKIVNKPPRPNSSKRAGFVRFAPILLDHPLHRQPVEWCQSRLKKGSKIRDSSGPSGSRTITSSQSQISSQLQHQSTLASS